jgi:hypothetical protein
VSFEVNNEKIYKSVVKNTWKSFKSVI